MRDPRMIHASYGARKTSTGGDTGAVIVLYQR